VEREQLRKSLRVLKLETYTFQEQPHADKFTPPANQIRSAINTTS
jgi:hypothetical protein